MIRSNYYAIYNGKEYNFSYAQNDKLKIFTQNKEFIDETFTESKRTRGSYFKYVMRSELDDVYSIMTFAVFENGVELPIYSELRDQYRVLAGSNDKEIIEKYQLVLVNRGEYEALLNKNKVKIIEKKREINW